jgi:hypothetical protein
MIRHGELWLGHNGRQSRIEVDEQESNPVTSLIDTILHQAEDVSPPSAALSVYDLTQAILMSGRNCQSVGVAND